MAVEKQYTYRAERVDSYYDFRHVVRPSATLDCADGIHHRECVLSRQVGYGGTLRVDNDTAVHLEDDERGLFFGTITSGSTRGMPGRTPPSSSRRTPGRERK